MLRRVLFPHARVLLALSALFRHNLLAPERDLIGDIAYATDVKSVGVILARMPWYYGASWRFRKWSRLRISSKRVHHIAREVFRS